MDYGQTAEMLARIQFAFTVSFHFIFPAFSIGTASFLAVLNGLWLWKRDPAYLRLFEYWKTIFAVTFAMGVVSGIVMSYQFGTNWSVFSERAGAVIGPLMGYEVLTAFFLEAGFLGIMLFGRKRVGDTLHMVAVVVVAIGTLVSATWILSVNSWMHTPAGFSIDANGNFVPEDWWAIVFNPSFPYRLVHTVLAAFLTTAFAVGAVGAFHLLRDRTNRQARTMFSMAMWMAAIVTPIQIFAGDSQGLNTLEYQPAKIAAMEGHFETYERDAPLILFGIPNEAEGRVDYQVAIPKLGSLILTHSFDGRVEGLNAFPPEDRPPVAIPFFAFRIMVGIGFLMLGIGLWSLVARYRGTLYTGKLLHRAAIVMGPSGFVAVLAGWFTTEVGRQPFTVYGLLRTSDSISPIAAPAVGASLTAFVIVYFLVFGAGVFYLLRLMNRTPMVDDDSELDKGPIRTAGINPGPAQEELREGASMPIDLPTIWAAIIAFAVLAYVVLDGFDLGVGILFPFFPARVDRDTATNSIAPVWDGNETWLVLGGGGLMAVFPVVYATVLPALYMPIILMLLGLVFRGVAFEFRWRTTRGGVWWDTGFWIGSTVAAFCQGIALGTLVQGITIVDRAYAGGWWDWLTPFTLLTGLAVTVGYALLGATWLNLKTTGPLQHKAKGIAKVTAVATIALIGVVSLWSPFINSVYFDRWFAFPAAFFSAFVPLLLALCAVALWHGLLKDRHLQPFLAALGLFVLSFIGLGISFYPYIVPGALTIQEAAAPDSSLMFLLVGAAFLIPIILAYTGYAYWVFRGKIDPEEGYH